MIADHWTNNTGKPLARNYDYIVVGAGAAGCEPAIARAPQPTAAR